MLNTIGPFLLNVKNRKLNFYLRITSEKRKNTVFYASHGFIVVFFSPRMLNSFFKDKKTREVDVEKLSTYLNGCFPLKHYLDDGIDFFGELPLTASKVYIKGKAYDVKDKVSELDSNSIYASSYGSLVEQFDKMALSYFKKRIKELATEMGIKDEYSVKLSDAIAYRGTNYVRKRIIKLNRYLYCYNTDVSDMVIYHELCHHFNVYHNADFYSLLARYCPNHDYYSKIISAGRFLDK